MLPSNDGLMWSGIIIDESGVIKGVALGRAGSAYYFFKDIITANATGMVKAHITHQFLAYENLCPFGVRILSETNGPHRTIRPVTLTFFSGSTLSHERMPKTGTPKNAASVAITIRFSKVGICRRTL
jgi:hypothetical protein